MTSATSATSEGAQGSFSKLTFLNSVRSDKKIRYVTASWLKFSLNLSTEEVCFREEKFSLPFKDKLADEKKLVQRGKFDTMTIGRDHQQRCR